MNKVNNKRRRDSQNRIERVFVQLLQKKDVNQISVSEICKLAQVNRSTFYANYLDIYDLIDAVQKRMIEDMLELYREESKEPQHDVNFMKLLRHISEKKLFYKTYFKLGLEQKNPFAAYDDHRAERYYDKQYVEYHIEFFRAGFNAIIRKWLNNDCKESPEEINNIIESEYRTK